MCMLIVSEEEEGLRLDAFLAKRFPEYSRTYFQSLIEKKLACVGKTSSKKRRVLTAGEEVEVHFVLSEQCALTAEPIALDILYEDDEIIAVNKPAGMVVHPGAGHFSGTFVNALLHHCKQLPGHDSLRPGIVHRLDKETSGVILAAKTERSHLKLVEQFAARKIKKTYLAICVGHPGNRVIEGAIGRHPTRRKEMAVVDTGGKKAKTRCKTLAHDHALSIAYLYPETGRTHQLRVHLQSIGHPILGDSVYGNASLNERYGVTRQLLHAKTIHFAHPITCQEMEITAPIPQDIILIATKKMDKIQFNLLV